MIFSFLNLSMLQLGIPVYINGSYMGPLELAEDDPDDSQFLWVYIGYTSKSNYNIKSAFQSKKNITLTPEGIYLK